MKDYREKRKAEVNEEIKIEEWNKYFKEALGGTEKKREGNRKERGTEEVEIKNEEEIKEKEMERAFKKLKKRKNGIQNEVWIWRREGLRKSLGEICKRVWREEGFSEKWK